MQKLLVSRDNSKYLKFGSATVLIVLAMGYLAYTGVQESKSYYVTIKELRGMGDSAYTKRLRVVATSSRVRSSVPVAKSNSSWWKTINS